MTPPQIRASQEAAASASANSRQTYSKNVRRIASDLITLTRNSIRERTPSVQNQQQKQQNNSESPYLTLAEKRILGGNALSTLNEVDEEINVNGERGLWINKCEANEWKGPIPLDQYPINHDSNPEIITKRTEQKVDVSTVFFLMKNYFI
jgi:hypothetical protein